MSEAPRRPALLSAYLFATALFPGLLTRPVRRAHLRQGAPALRQAERFGHAGADRPEGRLIWIHAPSVGELGSVLPILPDLLARTGARLLVTTTTQTAAERAARDLPEGSIHQFFPVDTVRSVRRFLDHWRPDLACFVEGDLWPRMLAGLAARQVPAALLNARASASRRRMPRVSGALLAALGLITTRTGAVAEEIASLGVARERVLAAGDLKAAAGPPGDRDGLARRLRGALAGRPVWAAVSTHAEDEQVLGPVAVTLAAERPDLLLIHAPRHPDRADVSEDVWRRRGLRVTRMQGGLPGPETQVWLVDGMGATGAVYDVATVALLGGGFGDQGGHNPYEAAAMGCLLVHGPDMPTVAEPLAALAQLGAAHGVTDEAGLAERLRAVLDDPARTAERSAAARDWAEQSGRDIAGKVVDRLVALLDQSPRQLSGS